MPNSTIRIIFSELAMEPQQPPPNAGQPLNGTQARFNYTRNGTVEVKELFVPQRVNPFRATNTPTGLIEALLLDYPNLFTATLDQPNEVLITSLYTNTTFSNTVDTELLTYVIDNQTAPSNEGLLVQGLESDAYLINNEINLNIASDNPMQYLRVKISNISNQKSASDKIAYPPLDGRIMISLSEIIKSLFDYPSDAPGYVVSDQIVPNANKYRIQIFYNDSTVIANEVLGYDQTKTFVRGGKRTTLTNQTVSGILTPTDKLPVWEGYPTAEYYLDDQKLIRKRLLSDVPESRIDYRRAKGCNGLYVKFLNQSGGYSNWMFESYTPTEGNSNLGGFIRNNKVDDLGNKSESKMQASSKIPAEYIDLISDLIVSPEIYLLVDGEYVRARSRSNNLPTNPAKRSYQVSINFDLDYRFKPAL